MHTGPRTSSFGQVRKVNLIHTARPVEQRRGPAYPGHTLTYAAQRLLTNKSFAREFSTAQISRSPFPNTKPPASKEYSVLQVGGFADWQLAIDGMVARPGSLSLAELKRYPPKSQVTQLICEEGWSFIAEWIGVPLSHVLNVGPTQK